ncbi:hypothetical protein B296_00026793 [Ensete ventricosum]|uniref:Uncharacterized protein n=1 Tax=Ensete ventricosum TaxID=4639 RepID=A0A426ZHH6_ENSVE|nr:hypothetical protein B296_00026793 [Ensete ventricosum]
MRLRTCLKCIGSSSRVSGVCQDGTREFARRRLKLAKRLSGVAEMLTKSWEGLEVDLLAILIVKTILWELVGSSLGFVEGIGKLAGNTSGDRHRKTIRRP